MAPSPQPTEVAVATTTTTAATATATSSCGGSLDTVVHVRTPQKMRRLREGMSLRSLSKKSGIAMPHLSRIFSGKRGLTVRMAKRIAEALDMTIDEVVRVLLADDD